LWDFGVVVTKAAMSGLSTHVDEPNVALLGAEADEGEGLGGLEDGDAAVLDDISGLVLDSSGIAHRLVPAQHAAQTARFATFCHRTGSRSTIYTSSKPLRAP
jgi:hypothetical protein